MKDTIYMESFATAKARDETGAYFANRRLCMDCAHAITAAIHAHFDGYHLAKDAHEGVIETYGAERVRMVLANTVSFKDYDGRFSRTNREWANSIALPDLDRRERADFVTDAHPAILDGFIDLVREQEKLRAAPSVMEQMREYQKKALALSPINASKGEGHER